MITQTDCSSSNKGDTPTPASTPSNVHQNYLNADVED